MPNQRWTDDEILQAIRKVLEDRGPAIPYREVAPIIGVSQCTMYARFGGWVAVKKRLGFPPHQRPRRYSAETLLIKFREVAGRLGNDITMNDFCRATSVPRTVVEYYFGRWGDLRTAAGLPHRRSRRPTIPDEALFADVLLLRKNFKGRDPTPGEYRKYGAACLATMLRRFGPHWNAVLDRTDAFRRDMRTRYPDPAEAEAKVWDWVRHLRKTHSPQTPITLSHKPT